MLLTLLRRHIYLIILILIISSLYHKFFLFGKIPFPGDLLVTSYLPWLDYYKFPTQNPLISDIFSQFFLWKYISIESFKNLQWPLWNPYSFTGNPLLATYHSATLYPLNILLLLPNYFGWGLFIFSSTLISSLSMYILLALWTQRKPAALLGAIIYSTSGLMTTWVEFGTAVHAMAWLPLSIFAIEKFRDNKKFKFLLLLLISIIMIILAGNAQVTTYSLFVLFFFSLVRFWEKNLKLFSLKICPIILTVIIAIGISMPQLMPAFDLLQKSIRIGDTYTQSYNFGLLPLNDIFKFFIADYYGNPVTRNYWGFLNYSETSSFLGTLSLPLLIFSILYLKKNRLSYFFLSLLGFALLLSFDNIISHSIYNLKISFLTSSFASRMLFMVTFAASILCALSLSQILEEGEKKFLKVSIWSWAVICGILIGTFIASVLIKNLSESIPTHLLEPEYSLSNFKVTLKNTLLPTILISLFFIFLLLIGFLRKLKHHRSKIISLMLLLLISLDLGRYFLKFNPFSSPEYIFPKTPAIEYLQTRPGFFRVGREHAEVLPPNTWAAYKLESIEGYDPVYLSNYASFIHFLNGGKIAGGSTGRYAELSNTYSSPYLDSANVKYFIGILRNRQGQIGGEYINHKFNEAKYNVIYSDKSSVILENPNALKRVYFAKSFNQADQPLTKLLIDKGEINPKETVVLDRSLAVSAVSGEGKANILNYSHNQVNIQTTTKSDEILVLADQYEEGWHAKVDDQETPLSAANLIFRAIKVPSGTHEISFYYWPDSFSLGLKVSFASIIISGLILLISLKKRVCK